MCASAECVEKYSCARSECAGADVEVCANVSIE
jgi:hypothetical protein